MARLPLSLGLSLVVKSRIKSLPFLPALGLLLSEIRGGLDAGFTA